MQTIAEKKALFKLPYHKNQVEYWGGVNHDFSDSFLSMTNAFLKNYLIGVHTRHHKEIFSAFVELVQNAVEYSLKEFENELPLCYFGLEAKKNSIQLLASNKLKNKDIDFVSSFIDQLQSALKDDLKAQYKDALLEGKSLGLILIMRMRNADFEYEIQEDHEKNHWLTIETTIHYESIEN